jgi:hypothetical protein
MRTVRTIRVLSAISLVSLIGGVVLLVVAMAGLILSLIATGASCVGQQGCNSSLTGVSTVFVIALILASVLLGMALLVFLPVQLVCLVKTVQRGEWGWLAALGLPPLLGLAALIWGGSVVQDTGLRSLVLSVTVIVALILALIYSRRLRSSAVPVTVR